MDKMNPATEKAFRDWLGADPDDATPDIYHEVVEAAFRAGRAAGLREALEAEPEFHEYGTAPENAMRMWRERIAALLNPPTPTKETHA